jgi:hypothetical protein
VPGARRVGVLVNPANATSTESTLKDVATAASTIGLETRVLNAGTGSEINAAFATFASESRHRSVDTLRGYVRDAELFKDHAGAGLL